MVMGNAPGKTAYELKALKVRNNPLGTGFRRDPDETLRAFSASAETYFAHPGPSAQAISFRSFGALRLHGKRSEQQRNRINAFTDWTCTVRIVIDDDREDQLFASGGGYVT